MNLAIWLERRAQVAGATPALMLGDRVVADYNGFQARAAALARALRDKGIVPGDRVAIFAGNCPEYLVMFYGVWIAGGVVVPINAKLHPREAAWIIEDSGATMVFASPQLGAVLADVSAVGQVDVAGPKFQAMQVGDPLPCVPRAPSDLCWLFYTSGTTGRPKGVCITHGMVAAMSLAHPLDVDEVKATDGALYGAPMSHGAGLYAAIHVARGAAHLVPASGGFDPAEVLELSARHGSTSMFLAPTMVRRLLDAARKAGSKGEGIRTIIYGGGPMYGADIIEAVDWFGPKFVQIYGQGECPMAISALGRGDVAERKHPRWRQRLASVGRAQSVVEVAIGGTDGFLPVGEIGEIMEKGAPVMPGYWQNAQATGKVLKDGWLMTGDMGSLDGDGYLTLADRSKDVIISGGSNIYPREVEEVLLTHGSVHEASVVGRASVEWGEDVVAFVVPVAGVELDVVALDAHCLKHIARFKRPRDYVVVDELPKNNYGKVLKTQLRARISGD